MEINNKPQNFGIDDLLSLMPTNLSSFLVTVVILMDGFSMLAFGFFYLLISGMADYFDNLEAKEAMLRQGEVVAALSFVYIFICLISLVYWHFRKQFWNYVILGLGLFHLAVFSYLMTFDNEFNILVFLFYISLVGNLLLLVIIMFGKIKSKSLSQKSKI
jgi:hypothetical protein